MNFNEHYFTEEQIDKWESIKSQSTELMSALKIIKRLNDNGFEALIVGGAVRDFVLGKIPNDIDITTDATPDEVTSIFGKTHNIGKNKEMGVSIVNQDGYSMEVATYRTDSYSDITRGLGADKVELTKSFKDDSSRRDLTINALGVDYDGNIIDHHSGLDHIKNKIISTVGDPNLRFKEDQVRILRTIRFASRLGFDIDEKTIKAIKSNAPEIKKVAAERITKEILKMAEQSGSRFADALLMLDETNLLQYVLPEVYGLKNFAHNPIHHPEGNPFYHSLAALRTYKGNDPTVNLCILFHDIGKGESHQDVPGETFKTFHGHDKAGEEIINRIAFRMKLDNDTRDAIIFCATQHMRFSEIAKMNNNKIAQLIGHKYWDILKQVSEADWRSRGDENFDPKEWQQIIDKVDNIKNKFGSVDGANSPLIAIKKVINGGYIMKLRNIKKPSREVGDIQQATVDYILNNELHINNDMEEIDNFIMNFKY